MHAEFLVSHSPLPGPRLKDFLTAKFNMENREAIKESGLFAGGEWDAVILFATKTPAYRLLCLATQDEELQIYVEPVRGNLITVCESVWSGTKSALAEADPHLSSCILVDSDSGKDLLSASTTRIWDELIKKETLGPVIIAIAVVVYATIGALTFANRDSGKFLAGAVSGVISAIVAVGFAFSVGSSGRLRWR